MKKLLISISLLVIFLMGCSDVDSGKEAIEIEEVPTVSAYEFSNVVVTDNYVSGNSFLSPDSGNKFVLINFDLKNNVEDSLNPYDFKLETEQGYYTYSWQIDHNIDSSKTLKAGATGSYLLGFEIPENETAMNLLFDGKEDVIISL